MGIANKVVRSLKEDLKKIREKRPLIHHITNYVAMNDSANATLAIGASPIMTHAHSEIPEIISVSSALVINIGTLDDYWIQSMLIAGEAASGKIPVLLDPVGAGATKLRTMVSLQLLSQFDISAVKGNYGEILSLMGSEGAVKGVDSLSADVENIASAVREFAMLHDTIAVATGKSDIFSDGSELCILHNGHEKLGSITASGCMLGSIIASFLAVQKNPLISVIEGAALYSIAGEIAAESARGVGSFRAELLDTLSAISPETVAERIKLEEL